MLKRRKIFALTMLISLLVLSTLSAMSVNAQSTATVTVLQSVGGTTDPTGTTTPADGTQVTFTATPDNVDVFQYWVISTDAGSSVVPENPVTLPVVGGTTYTVQAVFQPLLPPPGVSSLPTNMATAAIVVVLAGAGGTTTPTPGTYALADATELNLTATPLSGWAFSHWVIYGPNLSHGGYPFTATPTDNPYNVNHGYGNTFSYQPVFVPEGTTEPTPTVPEFSAIATIAIALALVAIAFGTIAYKRKK
jgi:Divergent InlB B-repeat domain